MWGRFETADSSRDTTTCTANIKLIGKNQKKAQKLPGEARKKADFFLADAQKKGEGMTDQTKTEMKIFGGQGG